MSARCPYSTVCGILGPLGLTVTSRNSSSYHSCGLTWAPNVALVSTVGILALAAAELLLRFFLKCLYVIGHNRHS